VWASERTHRNVFVATSAGLLLRNRFNGRGGREPTGAQETLLGNVALTSPTIFMLTVWSTRNIVLHMYQARSCGPAPWGCWTKPVCLKLQEN
jgi:hypothetical protein